MIKRIKNTVVGDVFCAKIDENYKKYLQYIVSDLTALNSDVIRAFKEKYTMDANPTLFEIINDEIDFYAHCVTKAGIKRGYWDLIGNMQDIGRIEHILFKDKMDYTNPSITNDWRIWKINGNIINVQDIAKLKHQEMYFGAIFLPERIVNKLRTGSLGTFYTQYE
jgi:hypothetical protein